MSYLTPLAAFAVLAACAVPSDLPDVPATAMNADDQGLASQSQTPQTPEPAMNESPPEPKKPKHSAEPAQPAYRKTADGIAGLPGSEGKTFTSLDDYLAHLEVRGHTDRPFWELLKDGKYRWNTGRAMRFSEPKYATREELLEKYGFSE